MILLTALALTTAHPKSTHVAAPTAAQPVQPADPNARLIDALTRMGFSSAAIPMLLQPLDTQATLDTMIAGLRQANAAIAAAAAAKPFDFVGFDKAIRDRQAIRADAENRRMMQISALIRRLPAADRPLYARTLLPRAPAPAASMAPAVPTPAVPPK